MLGWLGWHLSPLQPAGTQAVERSRPGPFREPWALGIDRGRSFLFKSWWLATNINTVDGRNPTWDVGNLVNNGMNYQPQLVRDFFHQQYEGVKSSSIGTGIHTPTPPHQHSCGISLVRGLFERLFMGRSIWTISRTRPSAFSSTHLDLMCNMYAECVARHAFAC